MDQVSVERPKVARAIIARPKMERPIAPRPVFAEAVRSLCSPPVAIGTIPTQPPQRKPGARLFGACVLVAGLAALGASGIYRLVEKPRRTVPEEQEGEPAHVSAARYLNGAAAVLSSSVLTDSGLEHFRGAFHNPTMYLAADGRGCDICEQFAYDCDVSTFWTRALAARGHCARDRPRRIWLSHLQSHQA